MKISAVIPVYRVERYLDRCMASLLAQTHSDWEAILVDDGSPDRCPELCDAWAARDGRVRVVHRENGGLGMARNSGIEAAAGEYLLFLDPDDYCEPELLSRLAAAVQEQGADLVLGGHTLVDAKRRRRSQIPPEQRAFRGPEEMRELLIHTVGSPPEDPLDFRYSMTVCGRLYRRSVVEAGGLRFVSERRLISEDLIFNLDFLERADSAAVISDASYCYCTNAGSLSKRHRADRFEQDLILFRTVRERLERYPEAEWRLCLARLLISRARFDIMQEADYHDLEDPAYPLLKKTEEILRTPELREALADYPWWRLPRMQAVFTWCMRRRMPRTMLALIRLKRRFL